LEIEKIPTAPVVCSGFEVVAESESKRLGMRMRWAVVEYPLAGLSPAERENKAKSVYPRIVEILTRGEEKARTDFPDPSRRAPDEIIRFTGDTINQVLEQMNVTFLKEQRGDGLPLVPATREAVEEMLTGISLPPDEVVGLLYPGRGKATGRKIAINAVMAGCRPEYMPVLIAAIKAITGPEYNQESTLISTGSFFPVIIVNGPVAKTAGLNGGRNAFGPCCRANATIGRAVRLTMINIGGCWPEVNDMSVLGHPGKYTCCIAENADASPWPSLAEEHGYPAGTSAVAAYPGLMMGYVTTTGGPHPEDVLQPLCEQLSSVSSTVSITPTVQTVVILNPYHARKLHDLGLSKEDVKRYIYENTRIPSDKFLKMTRLAAMETTFRKDISTWPGSTVSFFDSPERIFVIVAGAEGVQSTFIRGFFGNMAIREILS
jgi:hypothetical protein